MRFERSPIEGGFVVDLEPRRDERGAFARVYCAREFAQHGIEMGVVQANHSWSRHKGTLRGMHYQLPPDAEVKVVRCTRGAIFDAFVDLRRDSPTFLKWFGVELSESSGRMLVVPRGCAHGFLTLTDDTEVQYLVSAYYTAENERGVRWNDPTFAIAWPFAPNVISPRDQSHADFVV